MSPKKKKTEPVKSSPLTDTGYRVSIDPKLMGRRTYGYGRDPLEAEFEAESTMAAQELRSMRVEEMVLKRRARMTKLQKEIDKLEKEEGMDTNSLDSPRISVAMAQQIAKLPPEEREKVIETYATFRSIDQSKKGDSLLPLLIGYSKSNPGTSQVNMLDYAKVMFDSFKTGMDSMKAVMPTKDKASNPMEFMKIMKDLVIEGVRNPLLQAIEKSQPQPSAFEQILMNPEMFNRAKQIGMFGSGEPKTGSTSIDLEIEKLRGERQLEITKLNLDMRKSILELDAKDRRSDNMMAFLAPLSALVAGPVAQHMQRLGQQQGAAHMPTGGMPRGTTPINRTIVLKCSCGYEGSETFPPGQVPSTIPCPQCGLGLSVGLGGPPDGKTDGRDTEPRS